MQKESISTNRESDRDAHQPRYAAADIRLLTLKLVISKLADVAMKRNVSHVPYRDSKLTRLLQPSLSGDALISVICTISPSLVNQAESISTLAFASGLKKVQLRAVKKELVDPQALIQQYQNEIAELRALLREKGISGESAAGSRTEKGKNEAMEKRLEELKSLILTSSNVNEPSAGEVSYKTVDIVWTRLISGSSAKSNEATLSEIGL